MALEAQMPMRPVKRKPPQDARLSRLASGKPLFHRRPSLPNKKKEPAALISLTSERCYTACCHAQVHNEPSPVTRIVYVLRWVCFLGGRS